jgi:hypothetical protein
MLTTLLTRPVSATEILWQSRLRQSVRLHLALSTPELHSLRTQARLQYVERQLVRQLLGKGPHKPQATAEAHHQICLAQESLLMARGQVASILKEWPLRLVLAPLQGVVG